MRLGLKIVMVLGLALAILVPLTMIRGVIGERQMYRMQAVEGIARSYAGAQSFAGPVLVVPYTRKVEVEEKDERGFPRNVVREETGQWTFFPTTLDVGGQLRPGVRRRGLHEVRVYEWQANARARFDVRIPQDEFDTAGSGPGGVAAARRIGRPWLSYAVADVRGLIGSPRLEVNGADMALEEGMGSRDGGGVHVRLAEPVAGQALKLETRLDFVLGGTESLALVPLGKNNRFTVKSTWPHPRFGGSFLPRVRDVGPKGFSAQWEVSSLATNAQAQYLGGKRLPDLERTASARGADDAIPVSGIDAVGLSLVDPVNVYSQADRASKYGILFVLLTFVGFFMFELIKQLRIHPIQYVLVGLALAIFFLLLVSLSEHIAFGWAYLAASLACIGLLGFYLSAVLHSTVRGLGFAAMLATLYAALYGLLVSEDNALVLGSALLFVILAAIMAVTRKVDWYHLSGGRAAAARA